MTDDPPDATVHRALVDEMAGVPEDEPFAAKIDKARYRPTTQSEGEVTDECMKWLAVQPQCEARKVHGGQLSGGGEPDLDICWQGRAVKIELKAPGQSAKATRAQHRRLLEWQEAGALVGVATSIIELRAILAQCADPTYRYVGQVGTNSP